MSHRIPVLFSHEIKLGYPPKPNKVITEVRENSADLSVLAG